MKGYFHVSKVVSAQCTCRLPQPMVEYDFTDAIKTLMFECIGKNHIVQLVSISFKNRTRHPYDVHLFINSAFSSPLLDLNHAISRPNNGSQRL